jgi:hypothetical protein
MSNFAQYNHNEIAAWSLDMLVPSPGSPEERQRFLHLQERLVSSLQAAAAHPYAHQTVVVVPSSSLDQRQLSKITGVHHYEERMLYLLLLLRHPHTHVVYITSQPVATATIDYYLNLLPGVPFHHAQQRLTLLSCHDATNVPLSQKILQRPCLIQRIRAAIADVNIAHMLCFNTSSLEQTLAVQLDIPLYACDPALSHLGTKSGSREVFHQAGVAMPDGFERLRDRHDLEAALTELKRRNPALRHAVVKLNNGFSGIGNALFAYDGAPADSGLTHWVKAELPRSLRFEAAGEIWEDYEQKFTEMGGIVECFIEGAERRSPSVQCYIDASGEASLVSTHDQVLGGPSGQVFLGCRFPADAAYCQDIQEAGRRVAAVLGQRGAIGRFGVDFISIRRGDRWEHFATEINLRKGGTTHPFLMLQFLTDGIYDSEHGLYYTSTGQPRYYYATDNLHSPAYLGLTPDDFVDIVVKHDLRFHGATQQGVTFHLIGALSEYGKLGTVCIGDRRLSAEQIYRNTVAVLNQAIQQLRSGLAERG